MMTIDDLVRWFGYCLIFVGLLLLALAAISFVRNYQRTQGRHRD